MNLTNVQEQLRALGLGAWLLTDFRGNNPVALRVLGLKPGARRWWYLIPAEGAPLKIVSPVEPWVLDPLPGTKVACPERALVEAQLRAVLPVLGRVAMEYSPGGLNPYVGTVDAGTVEWLRSLGADLVSSADLVQYFEARWSPEQWQSHLVASAAVCEAIELGADLIRSALAAGRALTEWEVSSAIVDYLWQRGLRGMDGQNVSVGPNTADCHYLPQAAGSAAIGPDQLVLFDIYARLDHGDCVYADYTRMFYTGAEPPERFARAYAAVAAARDAVIARVEAGEPVCGAELDHIARRVLIEAGYRDQLKHRTGHSLGINVHGNGAHLDGVEMPDERTMLAETAFTVEPGVYFDGDFGVRSEVDVYLDADRRVQVTGQRPDQITPLG